ncbi:MAG TPA: hypothetical protein PLR06_09900 [Cyclobacteriaceae bacterium]|nr:hypothetical protein [Cyclobacteriaceae bacterium]
MKRIKRILLLLMGVLILIFIYLDMKAVPSISLARPSLHIAQPYFIIL